MATALARILEDDYGLETLIICPKNLVPMWEDYRDRYRLRGRVLSISRVQRDLPDMRRHRIVLIDESHNLRNREGKRYRAIREYIDKNDSKCILLSATPYNKTYKDLSSQLRLFVSEDEDLGIRPERLLRQVGEAEFLRRHQASPRSIAAFEQSEHADDWRELMRLYLVRRTRSFIQENYAQEDGRGRKHLLFADGSRAAFPSRVPRTIKVEVGGQYARLFSGEVVNTINGLNLPRYGLGNYVASPSKPSPSEQRVLDDLSRAGKRLMGFCRTNLFKRLESSGHAFLLSVERHVLRNFVFIHAIGKRLPLPIGATDAGLLDPQSYDGDADADAGDVFEHDEGAATPATSSREPLRTAAQFRKRAAQVYDTLAQVYAGRFRWVAAEHFHRDLRKALLRDSEQLIDLLARVGGWDAANDAKLRCVGRAALQDAPPREGAGVHAIRRHGPLPATGTRCPQAVAHGGGDGGHPEPDRAGVAFQPAQQWQGGQGGRGGCRGGSRVDRHGRPERRAESPGLLHRGELRPAVGHHSPHPASRTG